MSAAIKPGASIPDARLLLPSRIVGRRDAIQGRAQGRGRELANPLQPSGRKVSHEVRAVVVIRVVQIKPTIGGQWTAQQAEIEAGVRQAVEAWRHRRPAMRPAGQEPIDHIAGWRPGKDEQVFPLPVALTVPIEALAPANVPWYHPRGQFTKHRRAAVAGPLEWLPARPLSRESPPAMDHPPAATARKGSRRSCQAHPATPWPRPRSRHG